MKCPWREAKQYEKISERRSLEVMAWDECLKDECPFYGRIIRKHSPAGGYRELEKPVCRRAEWYQPK